MITITRADLTLLQDSGRSGFETSGVARSGAWDLDQYRRIEALLGWPNPVVFEVLAGVFEFTTDQEIDLALAGFLSSNCGAIDQMVSVSAGTINLRVSTTSYIGISGLQTPQMLGSSSTDTVSGLGPERVSVGQTYVAGASSGAHRIIRSPLEVKKAFRFISGPHGDLREVVGTITSSSRSGVRIAAEIALPVSLTLPSLPILKGAIQYTGKELIVVGPDGGVSGGYPVVGVVIDADIDGIARLREGDRLTFTPITLDEIPPLQPISVVEVSQL